MKIKLFILVCLGSLCFLSGRAQPSLFEAEDEPKVIRPKVEPAIQFIENKGQWNNNIELLADLPGGKIYLGTNSFSYYFYDAKERARLQNHGLGKPIPGIIKSHIFKVHFLNSITTSVKGKDVFKEHHNYYIGNDQSRWASGVKLYRSVTYENIYDNIEMSIYGSDLDLKYDFIVNSGGNPDDIKMEYEGLSELYIRYGNLHIVTSVNEIIEQKPIAFQVINGEKKHVPCVFNIENNTVGFIFPEGYDESIPLVIDPKLIFSTYSGSLTDNWGFTATFDKWGYLYTGGIVFGPGYTTTPGDTGFLPTPGAYQDTFAGGTFYACDMGIIRYTPDGSSRVYATYLGGSLNECPQSLVVNTFGDLLILGTTGSSDFPITTGTYDSTFAGGSAITSSSSIQYTNGSDIVIAKLNPMGTSLKASTYIGGSNNDGLNRNTSANWYNYADDFRGEIITDGNNNCYIASTTASSDFPIINGFQSTFGGGVQDAVVFKLAPDLKTLTWSSYLGGSSDDAGFAVQFNSSFDVYVCGGTNSSDFPTTSGVLNPSISGDVDGYVTHISNDGSTILGSTYIGTSSYDQTYFVQLDTNNNVYLMGQTEGSYPIVADSSAGTIFSETGGKQFIHKLNDSLSATVFSTIYGTNSTKPNISPSAFLVNNCENIFISGWGGIVNASPGPGTFTNGMTVTSNAYQNTTDGSDFHLLVLFKDAISVLYATFFGGPGGFTAREHVDGGTSRFDKNGIVYQSVCAGCGGNSTFPTTTGAWSTTNNSANCNNGDFKLDLADLNAAFSSPIEGCVPFTANFVNESSGGLTYFWDYGDSSYSNVFQEPHLYTDTGSYSVMLIITDSTTCQIQDTAELIITVHPLPVTFISPDTGVCPGGSTAISALGGDTYLWFPGTTLSCPTCQTTNAAPDSATTYYVLITDSNGCVNTDSVNVDVYSLPTANAGFDVTICPGANLVLNAAGGVTYSWSPGNTLSDSTSATPFGFPTVTTDYIVTVYDSNGCPDSDTMTVTIQDSIIANAGPDVNICLGDSVNLLASGGLNYTWSPGTGLSNPLIANPMANPTVTTTYLVSVTSGVCADTNSVTVTVNLLPTADAGPDQTVCGGDTVTLSASGSTFYLWSTGETTAFISTIVNADSTYTVAVIDQFGCSDTDDVSVFVNPSPVAIAGNDITICEGESATLSAAGGVTYLWNTGKPSDTVVVTPNINTDYWVIVFDAIGCSDIDSVTVEVIPIPQAMIDIDAPSGCVPFTAQFDNNSTPADTTVSYIWDFGDANSGVLNFDSIAEPSHLYTTAGSYTATLTLTHSVCNGSPQMTSSIGITVDDIPQAAFTVLPEEVSIFSAMVVFADNSMGGTSSSCMIVTGDGDTLVPCDNTHIYSDTGTFIVKQIVYNAAKCADTSVKIVHVTPGYIFHIPNSFSPNGDGINDFFLGNGIGINSFEMKIYNRWGDNIFRSDKLDVGWDGISNKGKKAAQQDVYIWVVNTTDYLDYPHHYIGHVTLIR